LGLSLSRLPSVSTFYRALRRVSVAELDAHVGK